MFPMGSFSLVHSQEVKPEDFEELRSTYLKRINEMFDTLVEKFHKLDV